MLSHECCVRAIYRELPALIVTLQQLYEVSGDAEAYGIGALLATYTGVASIVFLSEVLYILARMVFRCKESYSIWQVNSTSENHDGSTRASKGRKKWVVGFSRVWNISVEGKTRYNTRHTWICTKPLVFHHNHSRVSNSSCNSIRDSFLLNINSQFTDKAVKIVTAMSIFSPSLLPTEASLPSYSSEQIKILAGFYGKEAEVEYALTTYTSPPLLDGDELLSEWKIFRRLC